MILLCNDLERSKPVVVCCLPIHFVYSKIFWLSSKRVNADVLWEIPTCSLQQLWFPHQINCNMCCSSFSILEYHFVSFYSVNKSTPTSNCLLHLRNVLLYSVDITSLCTIREIPANNVRSLSQHKCQFAEVKLYLLRPFCRCNRFT